MEIINDLLTTKLKLDYLVMYQPVKNRCTLGMYVCMFIL